jgi:hypothetical protein
MGAAINQDSPIRSGTPLPVTRFNGGAGIDIPLAKYRSKSQWVPQIGDFIIWHGWMWGRWYGVINAIDRQDVLVVKENLPCLLMTMNQASYSKNSKRIPIMDIINAPEGEYHILQGETWHI